MSSSAVLTPGNSDSSSSSMSCLAAELNGGRGHKTASLSRYESQKRRDWSTFGEYLKNHKPPLVLCRCSGAHILEFLRYLDQFGKTKVHNKGCVFYGHPHPPSPCPCPLRQAWGSLDALVGRLRAAYEENGGVSEANPFGSRAVRLYLREVRESQAKARGITYEKKKRKKTERGGDGSRQLEFDEEDEEEDRNGMMSMMKRANVDAMVVGSGSIGGGAAAGGRCSMISPLSVLL